MFRIGQKVVCVDDRPREFYQQPTLLVKGQIYTIRGFTESPIDGAGLLLEEIIINAKPFTNGQERGYLPRRFRPAVERKTDTGFSILEEIRKRESVEEHVRCALTAGQGT